MLEKIAVRCYTAKGLQDRFGIKPFELTNSENIYTKGGHLDIGILSMEPYLESVSDSNYHNTNEKLGVIFYNENYYVASSHRNKFAFAIVEHIIEAIGEPGLLDLFKADFYEMYVLYHRFATQEEPTCQDGD